MSSAIISLLWEKHRYSRIEGEVFADVKGIGRFSIRKSKKQPEYFTLKLNGGHICSASSSLQLCRDAQEVVKRKMQEQGVNYDE